jgi:hypothetical protein
MNGAASELANCLTEAQGVCGSLNVATKGEGDYLITVDSAYYCRATDALAGSYVSYSERFATEAKAEEAALKIEATDLDQDGYSVRVGRSYPATQALQLGLPDIEEDEEECPF